MKFTDLTSEQQVALKNSDIDLIWNSIDAGTPIEIRP